MHLSVQLTVFPERANARKPTPSSGFPRLARLINYTVELKIASRLVRPRVKRERATPARITRICLRKGAAGVPVPWNLFYQKCCRLMRTRRRMEANDEINRKRKDSLGVYVVLVRGCACSRGCAYVCAYHAQPLTLATTCARTIIIVLTFLINVTDHRVYRAPSDSWQRANSP